MWLVSFFVRWLGLYDQSRLCSQHSAPWCRLSRKKRNFARLKSILRSFAAVIISLISGSDAVHLSSAGFRQRSPGASWYKSEPQNAHSNFRPSNKGLNSPIPTPSVGHKHQDLWFCAFVQRMSGLSRNCFTFYRGPRFSTVCLYRPVCKMV